MFAFNKTKIKRLTGLLPMLLIIGGIGLAGSVLLSISHASTPAASVEPELGVLGTHTEILNNSNASNGKVVKLLLPAANDVGALLAAFVPGTANEANPHGVNPNYDSAKGSNIKYPQPPNVEMTYINIRGAVYVDANNNVRPANTRVEIADCQAYGLSAADNSWQKIIDLGLDGVIGRGWHEDFSTPGNYQYTNIRTEGGGGKSVVTYDGYNFHYYNDSKHPLVYVGTTYSDFVTACSVRLVLADPAQPDDRASSAYIFNTGNDWKRSDNSCVTNTSGATLCYAIGTGRFERVTNSWRRVVYSTLDSGELITKPLPPESLFTNPDGSFGN